MPIDPSIPLSGRPVQIPSILDTYAQITQLQALKGQAEERQAAGAEAKAKREREAQIETAMRGAVTIGADGQPSVDYAKLLPHISGLALLQVKKEVDATKEQMLKVQTANLTYAEKVAVYLGGVARTVRAAGDDPKAFQVAVVSAQKQGAMTKERADELLDAAEADPAAITRFVDGAIAQAGTNAEGAYTLGSNQVRYNSANQEVARGPAAAAGDPPKVGTFEDYVVRRFGPAPTFEQIEQARKDYQQADDRPITVNAGGAQPDDVKMIVQGMIDGTLPPQLPGRASPAYNAIMAEAQRRGFNLAGAVTDWVATQRHIATLNNSQQTRLGQSIRALPEMLTSVESLAKQWKAGRFPLLNRVNLAAAKHGVYGQQAAVIANKLDAQIADVVADLGNVYMGGNSPTDHALELAGKSLRADWDEKVLLAMVELAKKNVEIRLHSINTTPVAGASEGNPYVPTPPPADSRTVPPPAGTSPYERYLQSRGQGPGPAGAR